MDENLVQLVTKLVVEKLHAQQDELKERPKETQHNSEPPLIQLFGSEKAAPIETNVEETILQSTESVTLVNEVDEKFQHATAKTPARIAVGRTGSRPLTATVLQFRFDHAAAVDAVHGEVDQTILDELQLFTVHTNAKEDKETYILRPDLGRKLDESSKELLRQKGTKHAQVQIIISNGLSASAINENIVNVYRSLQQSIESLGLTLGTPFYIEQGRVGLMDDIGELLQPEVIIYLIGERPGLVSAESMSAYICYKPTHNTIESDRTVVSNIHKGGIPPVEAGAYIGNIIEKILTYKASGVNLVKLEQ